MIVQMSGGEWARKLIPGEGRALEERSGDFFSDRRGTWRPAQPPAAEPPAPHGARRTRPGALSGRRGRGPAERLARDAGENGPGGCRRERPRGKGGAPRGRRRPAPAADMDGSVRPAKSSLGIQRSISGPRGMEKGPGGPSAERYGEKRGRRGGDPPAAPPRPSPRYTGRAPSTGQRRPALPRADPAVPSALGGLASGFGMGPGVPRPPWPLTGGRRSSLDDCVPPTLEGNLPRALGAAQRARRTISVFDLK